MRVLAAAPAALFRPNGRGAVRTVDDRAVARKIAGQLFDAREELAADGATITGVDKGEGDEVVDDLLAGPGDGRM